MFLSWRKWISKLLQHGAHGRRTPNHLRAVKLTIEQVEDRRLLAATMTVNTLADGNNRDNFLTLDEAILLTNGQLAVFNLTAAEKAQVVGNPNVAGQSDIIHFNIPGNGPFSINVTNPLPAITHPVFIDGGSQPGFVQKPIIQVTGFTNGGPLIVGTGLTLNGASDGSMIKGLVINSFDGDGIDVNSNRNTITDCFIGMDLTGTVTSGNTGDGIMVLNSTDNTIGGTIMGTGNLISGNGGSGLVFSGTGSQRNYAYRNFIGTDNNGTNPKGNVVDGVDLLAGARNNTIGGTTVGQGNVISGNVLEGVKIDGSSTTGNSVLENNIGTNSNGTLALANGDNGILIQAGATSNVIGDNPVDRNLISGNTNAGIYISGATTTKNQVRGNYIGLQTNGASALPNKYGVVIDSAAQNTIGGDSTQSQRNSISGNRIAGVAISGTGPVQNVVAGNFIGTDSSGTAKVGNQTGVQITSGSQNTIGGTLDGNRNIISGNTGNGIELSGTATQNQVLGNYIGTDMGGTVAVGNGWNGVQFGNGATNNTIGGPNGGLNVISGSTSTAGPIYGNGIAFLSGGTNNVIQDNYIGTDKTGTAPLGNARDGVYIQVGATGNTIGGAGAGFQNVIAANGTAGKGGGYGVEIDGNNNVVNFDIIGLDKNGANGMRMKNITGWQLDNGNGNTWTNITHN